MLTMPLPPVFAWPAPSTTDTASTASCRGVTDAKNESEVRRKLSLLLTPSIVIWINDSGSPLIVEFRFVPGVLMPGRNVTAFSAFRVGVGMRFNWSEFRVAATVAVCVFTSSELLATVIVSEIEPTSSTALIEAGVFGSSRTSVS